MAEDFGEKTEAPTARRRQEARQEGHVARSADLNAAVLLLGFILLLWGFGGALVEAMRAVMGELLGPGVLSEPQAPLQTHAMRAVARVAAAAAPIFVGAMILAVVINVMQVGLLFTGKRLRPNLKALNPFRGVGNLFRGQGATQLVMSVLKMVLVAAAGYSAIHGKMPEIIAAQGMDYLSIFAMGSKLMFSIGLRIGLLLLVLALLDYAWQRWRHEQRLKMSKQEVKEEMRRMEGDPKIRQRRRMVQYQLAQQRMRRAVPTADVVVTNPTEIAVALKYDAQTMHAPKVVAKGQGYMAQRIRALAVEAGVPIIERKPLARALFRLVEVGQEIPEQFYAAVAEILAYVYELSGRMKKSVASSQ